MSENEACFKEKEIVWVKLDSFWWPGEVVNKSTVPEAILNSLKKEPLAIVKYFDEDFYECIKSIDGILKFNCERKNALIKRGMDAFRTKNPKLATFPKDVVTAEVRCGGNPNILSDPMFQSDTEKRKSIIAEIFGTPAAKKPKDGNTTSRKSNLKKRPVITHRRFLGYNDYEFQVLIQEPGQNWTTQEETPASLEYQSETLRKDEFYTCPVCQFSCRRVGVIVAHVKFHQKGDGPFFGSYSKYKHTQKKQKQKGQVKRKRVPKKLKEANISSDEEDASRPKKKFITTKVNEDKVVKVESSKNADREDLDIYNDLLAEWNDEEDSSFDISQNEEGNESVSADKFKDGLGVKETEEDPKPENDCNDKVEIDDDKISKGETTNNTNNSLENQEFEKIEEPLSPCISPKSKNSSLEFTENKEKKNSVESNISCFDFEEEDEDSPNIVAASGRKIPRVIPITDKRKSFMDESDDEEREINEKKRKILEDSNEFNRISGVEKDDQTEDIEKAYQDLMSSTSNIDIPDIPNILKSEQNFHYDTTIKFPDKSILNTNELSSGSQPKKDASKENESETPKKPVGSITPLAEELCSENDKSEENSIGSKSCKDKDKSDLEIGNLAKDFNDNRDVEESSDNKDEDYLDIYQKSISSNSDDLKTSDEKQKLTDNDCFEEKDNKQQTSKDTFRNNEVRDIVADFFNQQDEEFAENVNADMVNKSTDSFVPKDDTIVDVLNLKSDLEKIAEESNAKNIIDIKNSTLEDSKQELDQKKVIINPKKRFVKSFEILTSNKSKLEHQKLFVDESLQSPNIEKIIPMGDRKKSKKIKNLNKINHLFRRNISESNLPKTGFKLKTRIISKINKSLLNSEEKKLREKKEADLKEKPTISEELDKIENTSMETDSQNEGKPNIISSEITKSPILVSTSISDLLTKPSIPESLLLNNTEIPLEDDLPTKIITKSFPLEPISAEEPELVPIDGNLTVVSEKDLEEGQVEIATGVFSKQPMSLSSFSLDFSEDKLDINFIKQDNVLTKLTETGEIKKDDILPTDRRSVDVSLQEKPPVNEVEPPKDLNEKIKTTKSPSKLEEALLKDNLKKIPAKEKNINRSASKFLDSQPVVASKSPIVLYHSAKSSNLTDLCDLEDHIPSQIVCKEDAILNNEVIKSVVNNSDTLVTPNASLKLKIEKEGKEIKSEVDLSSLKLDPKNANLLIKTAIKQKSPTPVGKSSNKAIILSESIIRPARTPGAGIPKRIGNDPKTTKIMKPLDSKLHKNLKTPLKAEVKVSASMIKTNPQLLSTLHSSKSAGKAKILDQTIITPTGKIYHPNEDSAEDSSEFDINSMPIVLSDELLTPESLEKMPIILSESVQQESKSESSRKLVNIKFNTKLATSPNLIKMVTQKTLKTPNILQTSAQRSLKTTPLSRPTKYVIMSDNSSKTSLIKKTIIPRKTLASSSATSINSQNLPAETVSHKVMVVTNNQGQQQRVLLTPAQQKLLGVQTKTARTVIKRGSQNLLLGKTPSSLPLLSKSGGLLAKSLVTQQTISGATTSTVNKTTPMRRIIKHQLKAPPQQKTIIIKNQLGQTVRKIQGTDDTMLDKEVAKQLESLRASGLIPQQKSENDAFKTEQPKRSYIRKPGVVDVSKKKAETHSISATKSLEQIPPLSPLKIDRKEETVPSLSRPKVKPPTTESTKNEPATQLVIQDGMGNMTAVKQGEIVAIPNDSGDGQNQSYVLFSVNEAGNLLPLSNEELLSLDANLAFSGGNLGTASLQINQADKKEVVEAQPKPETAESLESSQVNVQTSEAVIEQPKEIPPAATVANEPSGQQLVLTGDPVATQKFLDTLTDANTDIANLLASSGGGSFIIQADGQQILIDTQQCDNQIILSINALPETSDGGMFAAPQVKNQDILAAALADTDVFQPEQNESKVMHSQLSPGNALFPNVTANVLEPTSLTLNSPIMTPLEVPSTNSKKIPDAEVDILSQVPKNVDLPITITDPNISHTVSQQIGNEIPSNLELPLPVTENQMPISSSVEMNSPNFAYSLPSLDMTDTVEINQKSFNGSMPLLTEDIEEPNQAENISQLDELTEDKLKNKKCKKGFDGSEDFLPEGLCTLGGQLCSSLSEPPPEMFETSVDQNSLPLLGCKLTDKSDSDSISQNDENSSQSVDMKVDSPALTNEDSMEIPCQPQIVADLRGSENGENMEDTPGDMEHKT